jgi:hypothetical protein
MGPKRVRERQVFRRDRGSLCARLLMGLEAQSPASIEVERLPAFAYPRWLIAPDAEYNRAVSRA